jgi:peptidyl-prolyl cis-trans isomerase SurA
MNRRTSSCSPHPRPVLALTLLAAATLAGACGSATAPAPAPVSADTWATVDGRPILRAAVDKAFSRINDNSRTLSSEETLAAKLSILDDLVVEDILIAKANALKIVIPETELDSAVGEARKGLTDEAFQQELTRRNLTAAEMREGVRRELLTQKVLAQEVGAKVAVADQEVIDFFNANRAQFNLPEEALRMAQIVVTPVREPQLANRSGDDATTPQAAAAKVQMLLERLKNGAPFGQLAMDFSEDPESAPRGGDLGIVPMSAIRSAPPALRDAALKATPGTARVASDNGAHTIVFVVAHEQAGQRDLTTPGVKDQITAAIKGRREQLLRAAYLTAARTDARVTNYIAKRVVDQKGKP